MTFGRLIPATIPISFFLYQIGQHNQEVNRIYDDFLNDIERLENDIEDLNDSDKLQIFREEKQKAIQIIPELQKAVKRVNH